VQLTLPGGGDGVAKDALPRAVRDVFAGAPPDRIGVAVSGGGDSVALLVLLSDWARESGPDVAAVTVDHGLRPEAAEEAAGVARLAARLGVPHDTLRWTASGGPGNLPGRARAARYGLIARWAAERGIGVVALGHTRDDQAETVLMRLARGSGVDGLAGMPVRRVEGGVAFVRPLLHVARATLRDYLRARGEGWVEDPTNDDPAYDRVKARRALAALGPLGVGAEGLADTAARMAVASAALWHLARQVAVDSLRVDGGDAIFAAAPFGAAPEETRLRLVSEAIRWVTGAVYRPRLAELRTALDGLGPRARTLAGAVIWRDGANLRIGREAALTGPAVPVGAIWDGRWQVEGPQAGVEVRALGAAGLAQCPGAARETGLPRATLLASPAVWAADRLMSAPLARPDERTGWRVTLSPDAGTFLQRLNIG
jgi:tRNA(Ile)-lysidine synthase